MAENWEDEILGWFSGGVLCHFGNNSMAMENSSISDFSP